MFFKNIARILANFRLLGWVGVAGIASTLLSQAIILTLPQISQRVIDTIDRHGSYDTLFYWCAWLAGAGLAFVAVNLAHYRLGDYIWGVLYFRKNLEYKSILLKKNYAVLLQYGTGKLISRMGKGIDAETNIYYAITSTFLESVVRITAIVVILGYYSAWFALGFVGIFVGISCVQSWLFRLLRPVADAIDQTDEDDKRYTSRIIMENFLIRVSNRTDYEIGNIERSVGPLPLLNLKYTSYAWSLFHVLELGFRLLEAGMFLWFGWISIQGGMPLATVAMLSTYLWLTWGPIENMLENIRRIGREYESYARMQDVLNDPDVYSDGTGRYEYRGGQLKFEDVSFGYTENVTVLDRLSLDIEWGKTTALVGHSGSGKSTVMKLLLRIYDPSSGSISYDGQDLRTLSLESVYRRIGYLPQEPAIFDGTVRENLAYATTEREFSDHELWQALADARLDERIRQFEKWLDTEIGERGVKLSGGERQRLAIARIFLKNPDIILLDEPTSALDSISEKIIGDLLVDLSHGKTVVIIAHRLQTVMHADTIYVMDHGRVIERGTHSELLATGGTYAELVDLQTGTLRE